jgi:hypothetical protein
LAGISFRDRKHESPGFKPGAFFMGYREKVKGQRVKGKGKK